RDPVRDRPPALSARRRAPRAVPALPGATMAAQEPRAPLPRVRPAAPRATRPATGAHRRRPHRSATAGRRGARAGLGRRARLPLPARVGARLPVPVRGVRPAAARGDGLRLSRRLLERRVAARGLRRRRALLRPARRRQIADAVLDVLTDPEPWRERGLARAAEFTWERTARA